jgi:hypothetical protein
MRSSSVFVVSILLAGAGCGGRQLTPAPQADRVAGEEHAARAQTNGVTLVVHPNNWKGNPPNLREVTLPVHVDVQNDSGHPVQIAYRRFHVVTGTGFESAALPPFKIEGSVPRTTPTTFVSPAYPWNGFHLAPYYSYYYGPAWSPWGGPWAFDHAYYTGYVTWQQPLPTEDMLRKALPEGVLATAGEVSGFIYFQKLPENTRNVEFRARMIDAETEQAVASLSVPFIVTE